MPVAWFDCFSGIAGDMTLSALLHLGAPLAQVAGAVHRVVPDEVEILPQEVSVHGIAAVRTVIRPRRGTVPPPRDHAGIAGAVSRAGLPPKVTKTALAVFRSLAEAEARVHGVPAESIHFHELGAWDSIADVVGTAMALHLLGIDRISASPLPAGSGFIAAEHGILPNPAPATMVLLEGMPVRGTGLEAELVTPTGAALLKVLASEFGPMPPMTVRATGYGAGTRELSDRPNLLRIVLGEPAEPERGEEWLIETNLDDCQPQVVGHLSGCLLEAGALDVWLTPIQMKKGRPGTQLSVLCPAPSRPTMRALIFRESTAIGLRERAATRTKLEREIVSVETRLGPVRAKLARLEGCVVNLAPEFDDVVRLARDKGISVKEALALASAACAETLSGMPPHRGPGP